MTVIHLAVFAHFRDQLVLNQDQSLHRVLEGQLVFAHLWKNGTNIQVDVAGVWNLQALIDRGLAEVQVIVLNF